MSTVHIDAGMCQPCMVQRVRADRKFPVPSAFWAWKPVTARDWQLGWCLPAANAIIPADRVLAEGRNALPSERFNMPKQKTCWCQTKGNCTYKARPITYCRNLALQAMQDDFLYTTWLQETGPDKTGASRSA